MQYRHKIYIITILLFTGLAWHLEAFQAPQTGKILPNRDLRNNPALMSSVYGENSPISPTQSQVLAFDRLNQNGLKGLMVRWDSRTGLPSFIFGYNTMLTSSSNFPPRETAMEFLLEYGDLFRLTRDDLASLHLVKSYTDSFNGVTHLIYLQKFKNIPVFHGEIKFNVDASGAIISVAASNLIPGLKIGLTPQLDSRSAVIQAIKCLERVPESVNLVKMLDNTHLIYSAKGFLENLEISPVIYPLLGKAVLAWKIYAIPAGYPSSYQVIIDANTGMLLSRINTTFYAATQGKVFSENPVKSTQEVVIFPDDTVNTVSESPLGWAYIDQTIGNNLDAKDDISGDNETSIGIRATGTGTPIFFDFAYTGDPSTDLELGITNAFYGVNWIHDYMYKLGFNESAGNFQEDNLGKGGKSKDYIYVDVQDGSIANNASFSIVPDGYKGRMSLGIWDNGGPPNRDSALDMDIVYHEFMHGVSSRLVGGADDALCLLYGPQDGAISESVSDFIAASIFNDNILGEYSSNDFINGVRSTPLGANTYTYGDLCTLASWPLTCEPHADGEIFSAALWDFRTLMITTYGYENGKYMAERIVVDGLNFATCRPSFLDMRDAMLLADRHNFTGINNCLIWQAFSGRGMGYSAATVDADDQSPVEAMDQAPYCVDTGAIYFDRVSYSCNDSLLLTVYDGNASGVTMRLTTPAGDLETFTGIGKTPVWRTNPIPVVEVANIADITTNDGILQVFEGELVTAYYDDVNPAGTRTSIAIIDCKAAVNFTSHQFTNSSCDSDTIPDFPELPGFLDAGESADLNIYIANYEDTNLDDVLVTISCDNPKVTVYPLTPVPLGTMVRKTGNHATQYHLVFQCYADPTVVTGETATFTLGLTARGYKDTETPMQFTISMNHDYQLLTGLTWTEDFEGPSSTLWTHAPTGTNPNDEWALVTCDANSPTRSYHNGGADCSNYSDNQGNPYLASPELNLSLSATAAVKLRELRFFHNVDLAVDPISRITGADVVGLFIRNAPFAFDPPFNYENIFDNVEGVVAAYGNIPDPPFALPFDIKDNTGGVFKEQIIPLPEGAFPIIEGGFLRLDFSKPVHLIWVFGVDFTGPEILGDAVGNGYYLDDITLTYDRVDRVDQGFTCSPVGTYTPAPTITPYSPTPTPRIPYPIPSSSMPTILILAIFLGLSGYYYLLGKTL